MSGAAVALLAAAAWAAALVGRAIGFSAGAASVPPLTRIPVLLGAAAVLLVGAGVRAATTRTSGAGHRDRPSGGAWLLVGLAATTAVVGIGATVRARQVVTGPVAALVHAGGGSIGPEATTARAVRLAARLVADPRESVPGSWWAIARVDRVALPGRPERETRERVVLRGPAPGPAVGAVLALDGVAQPIEGDAKAWFAAQGVVVQVRVVDLQVRAPPSVVVATTTSVRERFAGAASAAVPDLRQRSLLAGLVTGDVRGQPEDFGDAVDRAGLGHLVAVSGSNVAIVVAGVMAAALVTGIGRRVGWRVGIVAVWWFVVLVRAEPSVVRAALMATLVLLARLVGRPRRASHLLAVGVLLALLVDPLLAGRVGFALSVAATLGVIHLAPRVLARLPGPRAFAVVVATTIGAQVAVAPVLLAIGGSVGAAAIPANVIAVPAAAFAGTIGAGAAAVSTVHVGAASALAVLTRPALAVIVWSAETFGGPLGTRLDGWWSRPAVLLLVLAVAGALAGVAAARGTSADAGRHGPVPGRVALPVVLAIALLPVVGAGRGGGMPADVRLVALDVGQGDAVLLGHPGSGWMLVDGGPDPRILRAALDRVGVETLAAVVLTHAHADHEAGLEGLLDAFEVGMVVLPDHGPPAGIELAAASAGIPVHRLAGGSSWVHGDIHLEVLSPPRGGIDLDLNESSLVLRAEVPGGLDVLLTGDAEVLAQTRLLRDPERLDVDVLKVPHHGGNTNAAGFLAATTPEVAIISVGEGNDFGHPHPDVLADLTGIDVRRTDLDGDVVVPLSGGVRRPRGR